MTTEGNRKYLKPTVSQVNPIVQAAADQVRRSKNRTARRNARDLPQATGRDQQSLFNISGVTE
ncbi:hypothetical protein [Nocardia sp. BMG111209]|uniref:hypothetical protein n=1 Tax=Nocardia sp. BMG111209 TaxID=1160137 RepID=UPI0009DBC0F1|nr:hypothetical protein [Nocardia sp. BMG111209]